MAYTYSKIASVTLGSTSSSIDFISIPQNYNDLYLVASTRDNTDSYIYIQFNNDSSATNYLGRFFRGNGSTIAAASNTASSVLPYMGVSASTSYTASTFSNNSAYITQYNGIYYKSINADSVNDNMASNAMSIMSSGLWKSFMPITSIKIYPTSGVFQQYSSATLYGIKAEV